MSHAPSDDGRPRARWPVETGRELVRFEGHTSDVVSVAFRPDGRELVTGSWDGTVRFWNIEGISEDDDFSFERIQEEMGLILEGAKVKPAPAKPVEWWVDPEYR